METRPNKRQSRTGRSRSEAARTAFKPLIVVLMIASSFGIAGEASASSGATQPTAECYTYTSAGWVYIANNTLESCARIARASAFGTDPGFGAWAGHLIAVDFNSVLYAHSQNGWYFVGLVRNENGSYGSLSDRCLRGDISACRTWQANTEASIDALNRLYG